MLDKSEEKILKLIKLGPLFIIFISIFVMFLVINSHDNHLKQQFEEVREESLIEKKRLIKREVESVHNYINSELVRINENIKILIKQRVYEAYAIAKSIYNNNQDKSNEEIKKLIFDALRDIRFNNGRGYYFIYDLDGINLMHPILKNIQGKSLWDFQDKKGNYVSREFTKIAKEKKEGFFTWWWSKPNDFKNEYEKVGFIKLFEKFNFYIGTGEYVIDYENSLKTELIKKIQNIRFGKNGYIFVIDKKGNYLTHIKNEYIGQNSVKLQDKNDFMLTYIKNFDKWSWNIGTGIYENEINAKVKERYKIIEESDSLQFKKVLYLNLFIFASLILISFYLTRLTKNKFLKYNKQRKEKAKELIDLNNTLEEKVIERTKELEIQKNIFETLFNDSSDGILLLKNGKIIDCNNSVLRILNYQKDELINQTPETISPKYQPDGKSSKAKSIEKIELCYKEGSARFEWLSLKKNKEEIWLEIVLTKLVINDEIVVHTLWRDISDKKILEFEILNRNDDLMKQKNLFETLVNSIPDIVWMKDKNGVYLQCNKRFTEFFGACQKEIIGKTDYDFVDKELADFFRKNDKNAMNSNKPHVNFEIIPFASDGHEEYTQTIKIAIRNKDSSIFGILGIGRDFTKEQAQKEELENTIKKLKLTQNKLIESEKMSSLGVLVAGIAHEINTPIGIGLTGVTHFVELTKNLKEKYDNEDMGQEDFEKYLSSSIEIANLIDTNLHRTALLVKNFKQISFDQSSEEKREVNLKSYIDEIIFSMNNIIKKANLKVINKCDEDINILTFPGAISQVITNLIINSIRHGYDEKDKGEITLKASKQEQIIKLIYKDDGKGIDKEIIPKIFDPFFTTNREKGGTGLGLNIIFNIVSNTLHGTINCESDKNKGVEFTILFQENTKTEMYDKELLWQI